MECRNGDGLRGPLLSQLIAGSGIALALLMILGSWLASARAAETDGARSILLVASNRITDASFERSVVLVTRHGGDEPIGVVLNRPTEVPLKEVFGDLTGLDATRDRLFFGGPVSRRMLVFVFRAESRPEHSVELMPGVFMSLDATLLRELLRRDQPAAGLRIYAGYAGWTAGQLEQEITRGDWHVIEASAEVVFSAKPESLWQELIRRASLKTTQGEAAPLPVD
jgi:putative transcriptional regulator